jgi:putative Ig domain-containing protein/fibronectin type III domain protein
MGGLSAGGATAMVQVYDPTTDSWSIDTDLPEAIYSHAAAIDSTGHIVVAGGKNATGNETSSVYQSQRLDIPDSAPIFITDPVTTGSLESPYSYNVHVIGNPAATYSLLVAPMGMTIDAENGLISWQPVVGLHGEQAVTVRAENQAGFTDQSFVIDTPVSAPQITSSPVTSGSLDSFYSYAAATNSSPVPTYSLVVAPAGMTISAQSGLLSWQPAEGQQGLQAVTLRAENFVGFDEQSFVVDVAIDTIAPAAPAALTVDGVGTTTIDLSWQPAADNRGIDYYQVLKGYRSGWRGRNTSYRVIQTGITGTSTTLTGLAELSAHKLVVRAVDFGGNVSIRSNQVVVQTQAPPTVRYYFNGLINGNVGIKANHLLEIQLSASANPVPTYALLSGEPGMTLDPVSGLLQWTPTAADVGAHTISVEATNSAGSSQLDLPITVAADLPVLFVRYNPNSGGARFASAGVPLEIQANDVSHTLSTFGLVDAPVGMTIDPNSGLIRWAPTTNDAGRTSVTIRGTNSAGSTDLTTTFETFFTASPTNIQVAGQTLLYPTVSWTAPTGEGAENVAGYMVKASVRYRWGRSWRTHTVAVDVPNAATSTEIEGLLNRKQYKITVNAYNATGDRGALSTEAVTLTSVPAIPNVSWTVTNPNGGAIVANHPVEIQLNNLSPDPATFALVNGPAGMTLDSTTGLAAWTPGISAIGNHSVTIRATNSVGPRDIRVGVNVLFSGAVGNVTAVKSGNSATVSWTAPTDNAVPIAWYRITMHWTWSGRRRSRTVSVAGSQLSANLGLIPTGAVWHRGVTIAAVDELGRIGASTPLVYYAG